MIKIRDLQYLDAIGKYRHFGKAAEACHVSQPTLSTQLIKLEEQLGVSLVERHPKNILLTPQGEILLAKARKVLAASEELELTASNLGDPLSGELNVGMIPTLAPYILPRIMPSLISELPKIKFMLHEYKTHELMRMLQTGKMDVLILPWLEDMQSVEAYDLFEEELLLAIGNRHELFSCKSLKMEDLSGQKILTLEDGHCLREQSLGYCFTAGADEDKRFQATSLETLRYMVAAGIGITLLPKLATNGDDESIAYLRFEKPAPIRRIVALIRPNYTRMECVREIVRIIRREIKID